MEGTFQRALAYYMALSGKNQQDIIDTLGYSSSTVSQWCTGKTVPRMDRIEALAKFLGVSTTDLLRDPALYSKENFTTDPKLVASILDSKPKLYDLFKIALPLTDNDLELLSGIANRINELQSK